MPAVQIAATTRPRSWPGADLRNQYIEILDLRDGVATGHGRHGDITKVTVLLSGCGRLGAALFRMCGRLRDDSVLGYRCDAARTEAILLIVLTAAEHRLLNALGGHARRSAQTAGSD